MSSLPVRLMLMNTRSTTHQEIHQNYKTTLTIMILHSACNQNNAGKAVAAISYWIKLEKAFSSLSLSQSLFINRSGFQQFQRIESTQWTYFSKHIINETAAMLSHLNIWTFILNDQDKVITGTLLSKVKTNLRSSAGACINDIRFLFGRGGHLPTSEVHTHLPLIATRVFRLWMFVRGTEDAKIPNYFKELHDKRKKHYFTTSKHREIQ